MQRANIWLVLSARTRISMLDAAAEDGGSYRELVARIAAVRHGRVYSAFALRPSTAFVAKTLPLCLAQLNAQYQSM